MEREESAKPYHDWNQRITEECYAPNAHARILDNQGYLRSIVNNYSLMSFNFGPTLLAWLQRHAPETYQAILEGDRVSMERYAGHGSAIAQVYNHIIMPLAATRDKETEIIWGIRDFTQRFGRQPEGMWLAETAVDYQSLDMMAKHGIQFTILSPDQVFRVRDPKDGQWSEKSSATLDTTRPYRILLSQGRSIAVYFYNAELSRAVAFEGLLNNGEYFAARLQQGFSSGATQNQLVNIATDGESYGHHHRFGEMALAYAMTAIEASPDVCLTNYAEFLSINPAVWVAEIHENTSWSCAHGVERWMGNCGCQTGMHPEWNQEWRTPLRQTMDYIHDTVTPLWLSSAQQWLKDPWAARDAYVDVILNRSPELISEFLSAHSLTSLSQRDEVKVLQLMELSRHLLLMYTSCGWFFDDIEGLEAVQTMKYAARAVQLAQVLFNADLFTTVTAILSHAVSNETHDTGRRIWDEKVLPRQVDLAKVALHYSVMHVLTPEASAQTSSIYCYDVQTDQERVWHAGTTKMATGVVAVQSQITRESRLYHYGVLHLGDINVTAGVQAFQEPDRFERMVGELGAAFETTDFPEVIRLLDQFFKGHTNSLRHLFRDEQEVVTKQLVHQALQDALSYSHQIYEHNVSLMRFLKEMGQEIPEAFQAAASVSVRAELRKLLGAEPLRFDEIRRLIEEAKEWNIWTQWQDLLYEFTLFVERLARLVRVDPKNLVNLEALILGVQIAYSLPGDIDLRGAQLTVFALNAPGVELVPLDRNSWSNRVAELDQLLMIHRETPEST